VRVVHPQHPCKNRDESETEEDESGAYQKNRWFRVLFVAEILENGIVVG
jgi:hypothetical protein